MNEEKLEWFPFYVDDFLTSLGMRACSRGARSLLVDLLCYAWQSPRPGYLVRPTSTGGTEPLTDKQLFLTFAGAGETRRQVLGWIQELCGAEVLRRDDDGLYNPRAVIEAARAREIRSKRALAGAQGAANRWSTDGKRDGKRVASAMASAIPLATESDGKRDGKGDSKPMANASPPLHSPSTFTPTSNPAIAATGARVAETKSTTQEKALAELREALEEHRGARGTGTRATLTENPRCDHALAACQQLGVPKTTIGRLILELLGPAKR
jgi:hypothetical protein